MIYFLKKFSKILFINILIVFSFLILIEIIFGYWFDKDNFGPYMREHRMKNQRIQYSDGKEKEIYYYRRNYYGFRGVDIKPSEIQALIMGGSVVDERYKPEKYTITGFLNKSLEENKISLTIVNGGIEGQSTAGQIYNFNYWLSKLENFSPKFIFFYIGINDSALAENDTLMNIKQDGHLINLNKKEIFFDTVKSKSYLYDSARIFKFKYLPREGFVEYNSQVAKKYKEKKNNFIKYISAKKKYENAKHGMKYSSIIKNYLSRVDELAVLSKQLNAKPIFITNIASGGHSDALYALNSNLIKHCSDKNYSCIDLAKKIKGKYEYWNDGLHSTRKGSKIISDLIFSELKPIINSTN